MRRAGEEPANVRPHKHVVRPYDRNKVDRPVRPKGQSGIHYTKEQIRNVFKSFDKDEDGQLSKKELDAAFAELGAKWPSVRVWLARWQADDNGDGFISIDKELDKLVDYALELGYTLN